MERQADDIGRYAIWMGYSEQLLFSPRPESISNETPAKRDTPITGRAKRGPALLPDEAIVAALGLTILAGVTSLVLKLLRRP